MQSTGHSSIHALSLTSTHGCAITYVTSLCLSTLVPAILPVNASGAHAGLIDFRAYYLPAFGANVAERHTAAAIYDEGVTSPLKTPQDFLAGTAPGTRVVV